jgi:hypothetical protein
MLSFIANTFVIEHITPVASFVGVTVGRKIEKLRICFAFLRNKKDARAHSFRRYFLLYVSKSKKKRL